MSNYTKSFNFRNGVQVDDSSLVVNAAGLVGVGTTRPEKRLDVFGNARVSGISSLSTVNVTNVVTIGAGITLDATSGIITATKFVGDASGLQNIVAIATDGWLSNAGTLSTVGKVGIGTTTVNNQLDVKGNSKFVGDTTFDGLIVSKNIDAVGIITATKFAGAGGTAAPFVSINVGTAATVGILTVNNTSTFNNDVSLPDDKKLKFGSPDGLEIYHSQNLAGTNDSYIDSSARNLFVRLNTGTDNGGNIALQAKKDEHGILIEDDGSVKLYFDGNPKFETTGAGVTVTGTFGSSGAATLPSLTVVGSSTFESDVNLQSVSVGQTVGFGSTAFFPDNEGIFFGQSEDLRIYHGSSLINPAVTDQHSYIQDAGTGDLVILSNQVAIKNATETEDLARFIQDQGVKLYYNGVEQIETIGAGVSVFGQLTVARLNGGTNQLSTRYGGLRYGNESGSFAFSTRKSLDLLNYDTGNINFYLDGTNSNSGIGSFVWHKGSSNALMTLNAEGNLGIGLTEPNFKLDVEGTARISGLTSFSSGIKVTSGNVVVTNKVQASNGGNGEFDFSTGIMSATTFKGNVDATDISLLGGTSKFLNLIVENNGTGTGIATMPKLKIGSGIGINEDPTAKVTFPLMQGTEFNLIGTYLNIKSTNTKRVFVTQDGQVGIFTDRMPGRPISAISRPDVQTAVGVNARDTTVLVKALGIGTADFEQGSAADFSNAGSQFSRYMVPPVINSADERGLLKGNSGTNLFSGTVTAGSDEITVTANYNIANLTVGTVVTITDDGNINTVLPPTGVVKVGQKLTSPDRIKLVNLSGVSAPFGGTGSSNGSVVFNENGSNNAIPVGSIIFDRSNGADKLKYFTGNLQQGDLGWQNV